MHEYKKTEKEIYLPKNKPTIVNIPTFKYFTIYGSGNPNGVEFSSLVGVLYKLSYFIRMSYKKFDIDNFFMYRVYPLEGVWDLIDKSITDVKHNKDNLAYKLMIRQPNFVTEELFNMALDSCKNSIDENYLNRIKFEEITEGLSVQMMHTGSFDDEVYSFNKMKEFIKENNLYIKSLAHKEIYISDPRKTEESKLKTVLRYNVGELNE